MNFIKYQASVFSDFRSVGVDPNATIEFLSKFKENGLIMMAGTVQEYSQADMVMNNRLRLASNDGLEVVVLSGRLDIFRQVNPFDGSNLGSIDEFCVVVEKVISSLFGSRAVSCARMSFVAQAMSREMDNKKMNDVAGAIFNLSDFHKERPPFEWTYRLASRGELDFSIAAEVVNSITKLERLQGFFQNISGRTDFDRIFAEYDINTLPENSLSRFDCRNISSFILGAKNILDQQIKSLPVGIE